MNLDQPQLVIQRYAELQQSRDSLLPLFKDFNHLYPKFTSIKDYDFLLNGLAKFFEKFPKDQDATSIRATLALKINLKCGDCIRRRLDEKIKLIVKLIFRFDETLHSAAKQPLTSPEAYNCEIDAAFALCELNRVLRETTCMLSPAECEILSLREEFFEHSVKHERAIESLEMDKDLLEEKVRVLQEKNSELQASNDARIHEHVDLAQGIVESYEYDLREEKKKIRELEERLKASRETEKALLAEIAYMQANQSIAWDLRAQMETLHRESQAFSAEKKEILQQIQGANAIAEQERERANVLHKKMEAFNQIIELGIRPMVGN